jgi:hypothetical protein
MGSIMYNIRNCQIKTMPCIEKKDLLKGRTAGLSPLGSRGSGLAGMGSGLYRRWQAMGEERVLVSDYL